jgi:hypothetical protein
MGTLSNLFSSSAIARAATSVASPGAIGITSVIGRLGKPWAKGPDVYPKSKNVRANNIETILDISLPPKWNLTILAKYEKNHQ